MQENTLSTPKPMLRSSVVSALFACTLLWIPYVWSQTVDDQGQTEDTATLLEPNDVMMGMFSSIDDADAFRIVLPSRGTLVVETLGNLDTLGGLFASLAGCPETGPFDDTASDQCRENLLNDTDADDDAGENTNFRAERVLEAGTYFVVVTPFGPGDIGAYSLASTFTPASSTPASSSSGNSSSGGVSGGGCSLNPGSAFDPTLLVMLGLAWSYVGLHHLRRRPKPRIPTIAGKESST